MKEKFGTACRFIGALVFSLSIMSVPVTATALWIMKINNIAIPIFSVMTGIEFVALGWFLFSITSMNEVKKTTKK